jgi:dipeptide/tripeptide permease
VTDQAATPANGRTWRFSPAFWVANGVELLERAAWYGVFVAITLYLSRILGFDDIQAGVISGACSAGLYLLPPFSGAYADRIGFRKALLLAFGLLTIGYGLMWVLPTLLQNAGLATYGHEVAFTGLEQTSYKWLFVPVMLVIMVGGVTQVMRRYSALTSMTVGMFIMPISAFAMAVGNLVGGEPILGMHPIAFMMVVGIAFQGFAESFISPRFLVYFSLQAPKGEEGLYLGFSHLHSILSYIAGFALSGVMLDRWCPEPTKLPEAVQQPRLDALAGRAPIPDAFAHAHYIWFVFVGVVLASALALIVYGEITRDRDARRAPIL